MSAWVALPIIPDPIIPPPPTDFRTSRSREPPASPRATNAPPAANRPSAARRVMPVMDPSVTRRIRDHYRLIVATQLIADAVGRRPRSYRDTSTSTSDWDDSASPVRRRSLAGPSFQDR